MNSTAVRALSTAATFIATYVAAWLAVLLIVPATGIWNSLLPLLLAGAVASAMWRVLGRSDSGIVAPILASAALGGAAGFILGFFGPMLLVPEANQGPMLGIFITGPAGLLIGLIFGLIRASRRT